MPPRRWLRACLAASGAPFLGSRFLSQKLQRLCASPSICRRLLAATNALRPPQTVPSQSREKQNGPIMLDGELVHSCSLLYILNQRPTADPPPTSRSLHAHPTHKVDSIVDTLEALPLHLPAGPVPCGWSPMATACALPPAHTTPYINKHLLRLSIWKAFPITERHLVSPARTLTLTYLYLK